MLVMYVIYNITFKNTPVLTVGPLWKGSPVNEQFSQSTHRVTQTFLTLIDTAQTSDGKVKNMK